MRERIYAALWSLITSAPAFRDGFVTAERKLKHIEDVPADQMPAVFMLQQGESWVRKGKGIPAIRTLNATLLMYVAAPDADTLPSTLLNNAMDALDDLFNLPNGVVQTLGGLVEHAYIAEGEVRMFEGLLQDKSPVTVPIRILIP